MVRVTQQFFKQQLRLFQLTRPSQTFDVPERAGCETSLAPWQAVHLSAFGFITPYERIFDQVLLDRYHRGKPHRIYRADEPHHRHQQRRGIEIFRAFGLHKRLQLLAPEIRENVIPDLISRVLPDIERSRKGPLLSQAQRAIECDPAHNSRMEELPGPAAHLPDTLIRTPPIVPQPLQQTLNILPSRMGDRLTILIREIDGIHHLAINVELQLLVSGIADQDRP